MEFIFYKGVDFVGFRNRIERKRRVRKVGRLRVKRKMKIRGIRYLENIFRV